MELPNRVVKSGPCGAVRCILEATSSEESGSMALLGGDKEQEVVPPPLPPRYRLRDLILGDYAFNDDGER